MLESNDFSEASVSQWETLVNNETHPRAPHVANPSSSAMETMSREPRKTRTITISSSKGR
jgi:hypothetical protein